MDCKTATPNTACVLPEEIPAKRSGDVAVWDRSDATAGSHKSALGRFVAKFQLVRTFGLKQTLGYLFALTMVRLVEPFQTLRSPNGQRICVPVNKEPENDSVTFFEIFAEDDYRLPTEARELPISTVIDLGANIGLASAYFNLQYPDARIIGYEPVYHHFRRALDNTCNSPKIELYGIAACTSDCRLKFSISGAGSHATNESAAKAQSEVVGVDIFEHLDSLQATGPFLLKMDIEGGEYDLFADPRIDPLLEQTNIAFVELHRMDAQSAPKSEEIEQQLRRHFKNVYVTRCSPGWAAVLIAHR